MTSEQRVQTRSVFYLRHGTAYLCLNPSVIGMGQTSAKSTVGARNEASGVISHIENVFLHKRAAVAISGALSGTMIGVIVQVSHLQRPMHTFQTRMCVGSTF